MRRQAMAWACVLLLGMGLVVPAIMLGIGIRLLRRQARRP